MREYLGDGSFAMTIIRAAWQIAVSPLFKAIWHQLMQLLRTMKVTNTPPTVQSDDEVLTTDDVCKLLKVSPTTFRGIRRNDKTFPAAKRVSGRARRWLKSQVLQWVAKQ